MNQYEATIFRAARILVDTSLRLGEMTWDEAVEFIATKTGLTEPTAKAEVDAVLRLADAGELRT